MNKRVFKKILVIIVLILIIFVAYRTISIYALFFNRAEAITRYKTAEWKIEFNGKDVLSTVDKRLVIDQVEIDKNNNVAVGKLAPNTTGNFYILIDPKNTDVAIKYSISIDKTKITNNKIKILSVSEINQNNILTETKEDTYTGVISLADIKAGKKNNIKVSIIWENDEANNKKDTEIGTIEKYKLDIPIKIHIEQYLGEDIIEYVPPIENQEIK